MTVISPSSTVTLYFSLSLSSGEIIDSNFDTSSASFTVGDGKLLEGFESYLFGLNIGDDQTFTVPPEKAFGQPNINNIHEMQRKAFSIDMPLSVGLVVSFSDAQNENLPGVIKSISGDDVEVDFNHPLAGQSIVFRVRILDIKNPSTSS
jgi:FKBP-type peptidyl-prolyl cis-trans isomerase SlpA